MYVNRYSIPILLAHSVVDKNSKSSSFKSYRPHLDIAELENSIKYLSKYYTFISLETAIDVLANKIKPIPYSMVVTFDDGYCNILKQAEPVLSKYNCPMTIFVITDFIKKRQPLWVDRLDYAISIDRKSERKVRLTESDECIITGNNRDEKEKSLKEFTNAAKKVIEDDLVFASKIDELCTLIESENGKSLADIYEKDELSRLLPLDELIIERPNVDYGSHSLSHMRLSFLSEELCFKQLAESKNALEAILNKECTSVAYPNGSYNEIVRLSAIKAGYKCALTTDVGVNTRSDDLFRLKRISICNENISRVMILVRYSGFMSFLTSIKKLFI